MRDGPFEGLFRGEKNVAKALKMRNDYKPRRSLWLEGFDVFLFKAAEGKLFNGFFKK